MKGSMSWGLKFIPDAYNQSGERTGILSYWEYTYGFSVPFRRLFTSQHHTLLSQDYKLIETFPNFVK